MRWLHEEPKEKKYARTKLYEIVRVARYGMASEKMVLGPFNIPVAGPFPARADVIIHPVLKTVEVHEKDKPPYTVPMRNLDKIRRADK